MLRSPRVPEESRTGGRPLKCDHCGKRFSQSKDLKRHIRTTVAQKALLGHLTEHIQDRNHMDVITAVDVLVNPEISKSIQEYTPVKRLFPCDLCDKSFSHSEVLQRQEKAYRG